MGTTRIADGGWGKQAGLHEVERGGVSLVRGLIEAVSEERGNGAGGDAP